MCIKPFWKKTSIFIGFPDYEGGNGKAQLTLQTEFFHDKGAGASFAGSFHVCCACRFF